MHQSMSVGSTVLLVVIIVVVVLAFNVIKAKNYHYECPKCQRHFKVGVFEMVFGGMLRVQFFMYRLVRCPYCGNTEMMRAVRDQDEDKNL